MEQLVEILPTGAVRMLVRKDGGIGLHSFDARAEVTRITEIDWEPDSKQWRIRFLQGTLKGQYLTLPLVYRLWPPTMLAESFPTFDAVRLYLQFDDYADAVRAEVVFIQKARLEGLNHLISDT